MISPNCTGLLLAPYDCVCVVGGGGGGSHAPPLYDVIATKFSKHLISLIFKVFIFINNVIN